MFLSRVVAEVEEARPERRRSVPVREAAARGRRLMPDPERVLPSRIDTLRAHEIRAWLSNYYLPVAAEHHFCREPEIMVCSIVIAIATACEKRPDVHTVDVRITLVSPDVFPRVAWVDRERWNGRRVVGRSPGKRSESRVPVGNGHPQRARGTSQMLRNKPTGDKRGDLKGAVPICVLLAPQREVDSVSDSSVVTREHYQSVVPHSFRLQRSFQTTNPLICVTNHGLDLVCTVLLNRIGIACRRQVIRSGNRETELGHFAAHVGNTCRERNVRVYCLPWQIHEEALVFVVDGMGFDRVQGKPAEDVRGVLTVGAVVWMRSVPARKIAVDSRIGLSGVKKDVN